jgi:hypothetical protein
MFNILANTKKDAQEWLKNLPFAKIAAHKEIHALTKSILQLYETLPLILSNSNNTNNQFDPIYEDTTSLFPEVSV